VVKTLKIGFTASQTGSANVESGKQLQGLQLWLDDVTKAGGIKLKDGTVVMPSLKFYDDESKTDRVQALYTQLINQDNVDVLISPYGSGLTKAAAVVSEQYGKLMITTGAADDATMEQGFKNTYQLYTPASLYLAGPIDLLGKLSPSAKKIAIVHENDAFSTTVAKFAQPYATDHGYTVVLNEGYDTGTTDFSSLINKIAANTPDAIMGGGHFADGSTFAKQLFDKKVPALMVALLVAPPEPTFTQIGDGAQYVVGPSQWEPQVTYSADAAKAASLTWYGISVKDFTAEFKAKNNADPSYHAAGGYMAGLLLQKAIEDTNGLDPTAIKADLDKSDLLTFYGRIKFSTDAKTHGKQVGHEMVAMQWQKDASGTLVKQMILPTIAKTADPQLRK
jgi:branched-chain amino acid transport system substrate-binding protein